METKKPKTLEIKLIGKIPSDCMIILENKEGKREFITNKNIFNKIGIKNANKVIRATIELKEDTKVIKLDKEERWICGERINISNNLDDYYKTLEYYRERNKELGYGNDEKNWEQKMYENQRRILKKTERIELVKKRKKIIKPKIEVKKDIPIWKIRRKELIKPKTEVKKDMPLGKLEDAFNIS